MIDDGDVDHDVNIQERKIYGLDCGCGGGEAGRQQRRAIFACCRSWLILQTRWLRIQRRAVGPLRPPKDAVKYCARSWVWWFVDNRHHLNSWRLGLLLLRASVMKRAISVKGMARAAEEVSNSMQMFIRRSGGRE